MTTPTLGRRKRALVAVDAAVVLWVLLWLVLGIAVGNRIYRLRQLSDTLDRSSQALDDTAGGLDSLGGVPFVGDRIGKVASEARATAASARENAAATRRDVGELAYLLGVVVVIIPVVPTLAVYVPWRLRLARERKAVGRALRDPDERGRLAEYLAHRALVTRDFHELRSLSATPWADVHRGEVERFAAAELDRLGVDRPDTPERE